MTTQTQMTQEQLLAQIAAMQAKIDTLQKAKQGKLTLKVSDKGACSLYGMGRWPVTLYKSQWKRVIENVEQIKAFLEANDSLLAEKE